MSEQAPMEQRPTQAVVIGIEGGGTHTRALCADLTGRVLPLHMVDNWLTSH